MARRAAQKMPTRTDGTGLAARWRAEAAILKRWGGGTLADVLLLCATEVEQVEREHALERLTLSQAAEESGFSYSALQHLVADGKLKNAGSAHRPRIRRADLPHKPGTAASGEIADRVLRARAAR